MYRSSAAADGCAQCRLHIATCRWRAYAHVSDTLSAQLTTLTCFLYLQEVVGRAYARLLAEAALKLGSTAAFHALWPTQKLQQPWQLTIPALYKAMAAERVVFSAAQGGQWLLPGDAVYCDAAVDR